MVSSQNPDSVELVGLGQGWILQHVGDAAQGIELAHGAAL